MADPLSQLRQFHINGREIKEHNGYIIFGDHGWPKNVNTNYQKYSTDEDKNKKEYYTLECLLYFLKNMDTAHQHYVRQGGRENIPVVHRPDRKDLLAYLKGEQQTSNGIDKNAPIPPLRVQTADIYKKDHHSQLDPQPSTSSQPSNHQNQHDASRGDGSFSGPKKRPHDPEMEKKMREEFAARLYEPSTKRLATIMPNENVERSGDTTENSLLSSKFSAEKLAALRAKHMAVKRTTIIDADTDVGKPGSGATNSGSKEAELLIAMDSDPSKLIKSKEKIWHNRSTILQSQSKNFFKTVLPLVNVIQRMDDPNRKNLAPLDHTDSNSYQQQQQQVQQQQQQQTIQRNAYNRYEQERVIKLDIGVEIDTKKSFVSGVANGLPTYGQAPRVPARPPPNPAAPSPAMNGPPRAVDSIDSRRKITASPQKKRSSTVPIIIIPATTTSLINMYNAAAILQDLNYVDGSPNKARESEILIQRKKSDGTTAMYKVMDNPVKLDSDDWSRVVAVFVQGPAWQFKGWPWQGSPVEIFAKIKGFHLKWDESKLDDNVAKWNVHVLELSRSKRHLDKANLLKFWSSLDAYMVKYKSFLKF